MVLFKDAYVLYKDGDVRWNAHNIPVTLEISSGVHGSVSTDITLTQAHLLALYSASLAVQTANIIPVQHLQLAVDNAVSANVIDGELELDVDRSIFIYADSGAIPVYGARPYMGGDVWFVSMFDSYDVASSYMRIVERLAPGRGIHVIGTEEMAITQVHLLTVASATHDTTSDSPYLHLF